MLKASHVFKSFDTKVVLDDLNIDIAKDESFVLLGKSGVGKSVLLKLILGLMMPDSGEILINGTSWRGLSDREARRLRIKFGMLFQSAALFDSLTVGENVAFPLVEHAPEMSAAQRDRRVSACLEEVDLRGTERMMQIGRAHV